LRKEVFLRLQNARKLKRGKVFSIRLITKLCAPILRTKRRFYRTPALHRGMMPLVKAKKADALDFAWQVP
jgi:hypothetical protein